MAIDHDMLGNFPSPSDKPVSVRVTPAAERAVRQGHPWLFEQAITHQHRQGDAGDLAVIYGSDRSFLALGLYDPNSAIRVRLLHRGQPVTIDQAWFDTRVQEVIALREPIKQTDTTGYRLVHGENDRMPGLIADRYDRTLVVKLYTTAWLPHLRRVLHAIGRCFNYERVVLRLSRAVQASMSAKTDGGIEGLKDGLVLQGASLSGAVLFKENGLAFEADPIHGHKTGFFLDQRDNRAAVESLTNGKTVLNVFAYSGGFSLYAARGGATQVVSLDISQPALDAAGRHFALNENHPAVAAAKHKTLCGDAFDVMRSMAGKGESFDVVIIDPPAFATKQSHIDKAIGAYGQLTVLGLDVLTPGGTIVLASCSTRVDAETFFQAVHRAARSAGRPLAEIKRTGHALDHPIGFKEGSYLKCLFATA